MTDVVTTGDELVAFWDKRHRIAKDCPRCGDPTGIVALVLLAYTYEVCSCGTPDYDHLVETLVHRACFEPLVCDVFRPFWVKGRAHHPGGYYTDACHVCGRLEHSHPVASRCRRDHPQPRSSGQ